MASTTASRVEASTGATPPPAQLAFQVPSSPDLTVHMHVTNQAQALLLFLSTASAMTPTSGPSNLNSFVFALPNQLDSTAQPLSTPLYSHTNSIDFMTRLAKILAKKLGKPAYVGGEAKFWSHEDEVEAMKGVVQAISQVVK